MPAVLRMSELPLAGKRVLIREDFNVPVDNGVVTSDARIRAALPTLTRALDARAAVIVLSHLGRPEEGKPDPALSLEPVAQHLRELLKRPVRFASEWLEGVDAAPGEIVLCENVRFNKGEKKDDETLARKLAKLCDVFVMDAFGTAHRAEASTHGVVRYAPVACAGPLLAAELDALARALEKPARPLLAIVGGSKVSTKLTVLESLLARVDQLIVGGGIANTFLAAQGHSVGKSLYEANLVDTARKLAERAKSEGRSIPVPTDVVVARELSADAKPATRAVDSVGADEMILDIGPQTAAAFRKLIAGAGTILWNGPVGVFEHDAFGAGTKAIAEAIAASPAYSLAGGGDTLAAIDKYGVSAGISYISTGGGAFLEFVEGKTLPAVAALEARARG